MENKESGIMDGMDFDKETAKEEKSIQVNKSVVNAFLTKALKDTTGSLYQILSTTKSATTVMISIGINNAVFELSEDTSLWIDGLPHVIQILSDDKKSGNEIYDELLRTGVPLGEIPESKSIMPTNEKSPRATVVFGKMRLFAIGCMNRVCLPQNTFWVELFGADEIGFMAFKNNYTILSLQLPDGIKKIEAYAFSGCSRLQSVVIPDGVEVLESAAFHACVAMESVKLPSSVREIEEDAFNWCHGLKSIEYSGSVAQWEAVKKGDRWNDEVPAKFVQCSDGKVSF